jgi:hypothetical protein
MNTLAGKLSARSIRTERYVYLLDDVGAEFLDRQGADVASELTDNGIAEPVVVQVENVLNDL